MSKSKTAREILLKTFQKIEIDYDKERDRFTGVVTLPDGVLNQALSEIDALVPKKKEELKDCGYNHPQRAENRGYNQAIDKTHKIFNK